MTNRPYLEQCIETIAEVNTSGIAAMRRGKLLGSSDNNGYSVYALGRAEGNIDLHLAVKAATGRDFLSRVMEEIAAVDEMIRKAPSLQGKMPFFIGLLAVGDSNNLAGVITEDATRSGELTIEPISASTVAVEELKAGFGEEAEEAVEDIELEGSVAFSVGGTERWLDFTPSPVYTHASLRDPFGRLKAEVAARRDELTVTVPEDSLLSVSLASV